MAFKFNHLHTLLLAAAATWCTPLALAVPWSEYILSPAERNLQAVSVHSTSGHVINAHALTASVGGEHHSIATLGPNASTTLDFGLNLAGNVHFTVASVSTPAEALAISFSESSQWISPAHCDSAFGEPYDDPLVFRLSHEGAYAADKQHQRGGFRFLTVWHNTSGVVDLAGLSVNFTAEPVSSDMRAYKGWFHSDSERLNRVWYAGAYTNQLCTIDPKYGSTLFVGSSGWSNNYTIANGSSVLVDGAKRDRLVWAGDLVISAPSVFVSTGEAESIRNAIDALFVLQDDRGRLPVSSAPYATINPGFFYGDCYHLYSLQMLHTYYVYTGDLAYVQSHWEQFKKALTFSIGLIDATGMVNVSSGSDWGRYGFTGHNIEANAVMYYTLGVGIELANIVGDLSHVKDWEMIKNNIQASVNAKLWDPTAQLFLDNDTIPINKTLHPQDGNVWAVLSGLVPHERAKNISTSLMSRWVKPFGAPAPEAGETVSPFITGLEIRAHFLAGYPDRAIDLMEWMWADFMLDDPRMTGSTFIEGYSKDGRIRYPPHKDVDQRISYAHAWSSGPTSALTNYVVGLEATGPGGKSWKVQPRLGRLTYATAGFETPFGLLSATWRTKNGCTVGEFETPQGSEGVLVLPRTERQVVVRCLDRVMSPSAITESSLVFTDLPGGVYFVHTDT